MCIYWANAPWRGHRDNGFATLKGKPQSDLNRLALLAHERPVDSYDTLFRKSLQRLWKNQISPFVAFLETDYAEIGSSFALQHCHQMAFLYLILEVTIRRGLLPKRVNLRFTGVFNHLGKTGCFGFKKLHD
jgi:hypothetical protein